MRPGDGDDGGWMVWDNAMHGHRGTCSTEIEPTALAGDLELQYAVHGPRDQASVRRVDPPMPVDGRLQRVGELGDKAPTASLRDL
ncbi:hypothetical protein [Kribbella sp. NPDC049227]|uniref:hypothetical protein n=1 Tax=Kribbella sp. NPDC049227 TaxID=3364113 RepID=UPI00371BFF8C